MDQDFYMSDHRNSFSNKILEVQFKRDIQKMYELYDLEGGEEQ